MKNFIYRFLIVVTILCSVIYISSVDTIKDTGVFIISTIITVTLFLVSWLVFKNMDQEDLYEIFFVNKLKKIGYDINHSPYGESYAPWISIKEAEGYELKMFGNNDN